MFSKALIAGIFLSIVGFPQAHATDQISMSTLSHMDPHPSATSGAWFEGWYTRIVDPASGRSIAVITTSYLGPNEKPKEPGVFHGYLAIVASDGDGKRTRSWEYFPETKLSKAGVALDSNSASTVLDKTDNFLWQAGDMASLDQQKLKVSIPDLMDLEVDFGKTTPWATNLGPEGLASLISLMPLQWFVGSLNTDSAINLVSHDANLQSWQGVAHAHQEKNWGRVFPRGWMWVEGMNEGEGAEVTAAGGHVVWGPLSLKSWFVGMRHGDDHFEFAPTQVGTRYQTKIDSCAGTFELTATSLTATLDLKAKADPESFAPVSIPTDAGYIQGGHESFVATIDVTAHHFSLGAVHETTLHFDKAALEFGAEYDIRTDTSCVNR